jgi:hypothetical protein
VGVDGDYLVRGGLWKHACEELATGYPFLFLAISILLRALVSTISASVIEARWNTATQGLISVSKQELQNPTLLEQY